MNTFDIALTAIVAFSLVAGLLKGIIREAFSLAGVVLGIFAALALAPSLGESLLRWIPLPEAAYATALLVVFLVVMIVSEILVRFLTKLIKFVKLGPINHVLGALFGVVRGVVIGIVVVIGLALFLDPGHELLSRSRVVPYLTWGARALAPLLPDRIEAELSDRLDEIDSARELPGVEI